jgi:DNA-directed RNA polymerase specialized sigma24 family protein
MSDLGEQFRDLLLRLRAGDHGAAAELVRQYEPELRRFVRVRLRHDPLLRVLSESDVCQSVLGSFFLRAALGQYDLACPEQLLRLLKTMARNKLLTQATAERAARRDRRRLEPGSLSGREPVDPAPGPGEELELGELRAKFLALLSPEERRLADLRLQGWDWPRIAAELGGTAEARRKQLERASRRAEAQLGLGESRRE